MRWALALISTIAWGVSAYPQGIISQNGFVTLAPVYQSWNLNAGSDFAEGTPLTDSVFSEFTVPVYIYYPVNRNLSFSLRGNQSSASGDNLETLNGLTDTQLGVNYYLENPNIVLNVGFNLPTGKAELSFSEFRTSSLISNNIFGMRTPNFGQGLNVTAGFTWAIPMTEALVVGLGASYQRKGGFKPLDGFIEDYRPGDEILLTGGFDIRLGPTSTISSDVTLTLYKSDKIGDDEVFSIGNKIVIYMQFRQFFGFNELRVLARFRSRAKNERAIILGQQLEPESLRTFPNQFELSAHYRIRLSRSFYVKIIGEGRFYEQTLAAFSGVDLFAGGVAPEISLSQSLSLPITLKYLKGSFKSGSNLTGFELAAGLSLAF